MMVGEPTIIPEGVENAEFWYNDQLRQLFFAAQNLQLSSRDGTIQNFDKAGNLSAVFAVFTSNAVATTEDAVTHTLSRVPVGYIVVKQDKAAVLYDSGTAFTDSVVYFKSSVATVAWTVMLF